MKVAGVHTALGVQVGVAWIFFFVFAACFSCFAYPRPPF